MGARHGAKRNDGDLVHFFQVLREQPEALVECIKQGPFSRRLHKRWAKYYYSGYWPTDDVPRGGRFFCLRYTQWGGGYDAPTGFATGKTKSTAQAYANKIDRLEKFGERFRDVILENLDWSAVLEKYDSLETVFYLGPPYVGAESTYPVGQIDHEALLDALRELEGTAICSYEDLPANAGELQLVGRGGDKRFTNNGKQGKAKDATERLVMNFQSI